MNFCSKLAALLLAVCVVSAAQAATEYRYTMIFNGHVGGEHVTRIADDGSIATDFSYRTNGRGPDYKEKIVLALQSPASRLSARWSMSASSGAAIVRNGAASSITAQLRSPGGHCTCRSNQPSK
jgi:hypothetical protein